MRPAALLVTLLVACDINGGGQTFPGASVYQSPSGDFHLHYLAPPWRHGPPETDKLVHLVVDNFGQFTTTDKALTYQMWASYSPELSTRAAAEALSAELTGAGRTITRPVSVVSSLSGDRGWQLLAQRDALTGRSYYRECLFEATPASGKVVRLSLTGMYPLDEQDVDDLVLSFSAGADSGTRVPPSHLDAAPSRQDAKSP